MLLRQFPADAHRAVSQRIQQDLQCPYKTVRSLIQNDGPGLLLQFLKNSLPLLLLRRKKSLEAEPSCRLSGGNERIYRRAGSRDRNHPDAGLHCHLHQDLTGIGDTRRSGVRHTGNRLSFEHTVHQCPRLRHLIVFMVAGHRRVDIEVIEKPDASPGILRGDQIRFLQDPDRPEGHILQIPDRRRHHIQHSAVSHTDPEPPVYKLPYPCR